MAVENTRRVTRSRTRRPEKISAAGKPWSDPPTQARLTSPTFVPLPATERARAVAALAECFAALLARGIKAAS